MKNRIPTYFFAFLFLIGFSVGVLAQTTPGEPFQGTGYESSGHKIAPPSPTAAALGKFGEYNVGGSSGIPAINIPLFEIKGVQMSVPVSLSYAGSGIKVNDIASWVGMGWSLNAGGVITRTVLGNPDESSGIYQLYSSSPDFDPATFPPYVVGSTTQGFHTQLAGGHIKGEPDIYSFNFLGYSGQFYIDHEEEFHFFEQQDLKIKREVFREFTLVDVENKRWKYNRRYEFTITTGDGVQAVFTNSEVTTYDTGDGSSYTAETAWYLTELTKGDDTFTFSYVDEAISYGYQFSETEFASSQTWKPCGSVNQGRQGTYGASLLIDRKRLTGITGPFGTATFNPESIKRKDVGGKSLDDIQYRDITVDFNTFYDEGVYSLSREGVRSRLFLNAVTVISGNDSKGFSFEYDETKLPPTNSFAQDYWGYFNGKKGNTTLLPQTSFPFFSGGANREADGKFMRAGILTKIIYPTGGYTVFEWNPNHTVKTTTKSRDVCRTKASANYYCNSADPFGYGDVRSHPFTLTHLSDIYFTLDVGYLVAAAEPDENNPCSANEEEPGSVIIRIYNGGSKIFQRSLEHDDSDEIIITGLNPGNYTVSLENEFPVLDKVRLSLRECHKEITTTTTTTYYGGLRVASVKNYLSSEHASPFTQTNYSYGNVVSSSGRSGNDFVDSFEVNCGDGNPIAIQRRSSGHKRNKSDGVSYDKIRETYSDGSSKLTEFYTVPDNFTGSGATQNKSWMRSKPKKVHLFDNRQNEVKLDEYNYSLIRRDEYLGIFISKVIKSVNPNSFEYLAIEHQVVSLQSDWARLDNIVTTEFFPSGELVTTQDFNYFRPETHVRPGSITTTFPDGTKRTKVTLYPLDIDDALPGGDLRNNYYLKPIESITYDPDQDKILSGQRMAYTNHGQLEFQWNLDFDEGITYSGFKFSTGKSNPAVLGTSYFDNLAYGDEEVHIESDEYRTRTIDPRSGDLVTYLWGYENKYPVAELQNVTIDGLLDLGVRPEAITNLQNSTDEETIKLLLSQVRDRLSSDMQMTSYLYKTGIGVSEIIDINRRSTYFTYDGMGRLLTVQDDNGNLLSSHEYQYALETK